MVPRGSLWSQAMHRVQRLILVWAIKRVDVFHCLTCGLTLLTLTACQIRRHSHLWDHHSIRQLKTLVPRRCLESHTMHRVRQLILMWTTKSVVVSHCITLFQNQLILTLCQICLLSHLWDQRSIGQLRTVVPRRCVGCHMMHKVRPLILMGTMKRVAMSHCLTSGSSEHWKAPNLRSERLSQVPHCIWPRRCSRGGSEYCGCPHGCLGGLRVL